MYVHVYSNYFSYSSRILFDISKGKIVHFLYSFTHSHGERAQEMSYRLKRLSTEKSIHFYCEILKFSGLYF